MNYERSPKPKSPFWPNWLRLTKSANTKYMMHTHLICSIHSLDEIIGQLAWLTSCPNMASNLRPPFSSSKRSKIFTYRNSAQIPSEYLNSELKTRRAERLSIRLIFIHPFVGKIIFFSFMSKLLVCSSLQTHHLRSLS